MKNRLTEIFGTRNVLCDGAMGTSLYARGIFINRCYDELNLSQPELVRNIHDEYLQAGAEIIETNTFGANALRLQRYGLADKVIEINRAGVEIARKAVNQRADKQSGKVWVAGAVGPLGARLEPLGKIGLDEAQAAFAEQIRGLADGGVDLLLIETVSISSISTPPATRPRICSAKAARASSRPIFPNGSRRAPRGPMAPATQAFPLCLSARWLQVRRSRRPSGATRRTDRRPVARTAQIAG